MSGSDGGTTRSTRSSRPWSPWSALPGQPTSRGVELGWHGFVGAASLATLVALALPEPSPIRHVVGIVFVVLVPGMALTGRSRHLRARGLLSAATWTLVVPLSFTVGAMASLLSVYSHLWAPRLIVVTIAIACAASSGGCLRVLTTSPPDTEGPARP